MLPKNKPARYDDEIAAENHENGTIFWVVIILFLLSMWGIIHTMEGKTGQRAVQVLGDTIAKHEIQPAHVWWDNRNSPVTEE